MDNPHPDTFTDDDVRHILTDLRHDQPRWELNRVKESDVDPFFRRCAAGNWLALGLDILTDLTASGGRPTLSRSELQEALEERITEAATEATDEYPDPWNPNRANLARTWLDISLYRLWRIIDNARRAGIEEFENQFLGMASGDESGSTLGGTIHEAFSDGVRGWRDEQKP